MSGRTWSLDDAQFSLANLFAKHGVRLLVLFVVLALYAGGAAAESVGTDVFIEPMGETEKGDEGP